jgi:hypothetical protein
MTDAPRLTSIAGDQESRLQCPFCKGQLFESWDDDVKETATPIEVRSQESAFQVREPALGTAQAAPWRGALPPRVLMCVTVNCKDADGIPHFFDLSKEGRFDSTLG